MQIEIPSLLSVDTINLIENLLRLEPSERLGSNDTASFEELKAHPYFSEIDFEAIVEGKEF